MKLALFSLVAFLALAGTAMAGANAVVTVGNGNVCWDIVVRAGPHAVFYPACHGAATPASAQAATFATPENVTTGAGPTAGAAANASGNASGGGSGGGSI